MVQCSQMVSGLPVLSRLGVAALTGLAFAGEDLSGLASELLVSVAMNPNNSAALMDLSVIEQLRGNERAGLEYQAAALKQNRLFRTASGLEPDFELLVLAAPGRMGWNTPVEFLLEGKRIGITTLYVVPGQPLPDPLPCHDLAFVAATGDKDGSRELLSNIEQYLPHWPRPVLNLPSQITRLERDELWQILRQMTGAHVPETRHYTRGELGEVFACEHSAASLPGGFQFPLLIRPLGSHAGMGLCKLDRQSDLPRYLAGQSGDEFFVTRFVDYRSADGLYRKYRIVFVDGRPFPCHMAIADRWDVWYLNADMDGSASKRAEEERFFQNFTEDFAIRHAAALDELCQRVKLDYFGIDCAETRDGELVVFEADNALIVHAMDPVDIYPYKPGPMGQIRSAFDGMLRARAAALAPAQSSALAA